MEVGHVEEFMEVEDDLKKPCISRSLVLQKLKEGDSNETMEVEVDSAKPEETLSTTQLDESSQKLMKEPVEETVKKEETDMWVDFLHDNGGKDSAWIAPPEWFKDAPFRSNWNKVALDNLFVEIRHPYEEELADRRGQKIYAVAEIRAYAGYYALVKYINVPGDSNPSILAWCVFPVSEIKPFGFSYSNNYLIHPMTRDRLSNQELGKATAAMLETIPVGQPSFATIPKRFEKRLKKEFKRLPSRFKLNEYVEAMDMTRIHRYVYGQVAVVAGTRIFVRYLNGSKERSGFWYHQSSSVVHKLGWCQEVGTQIIGNRPDVLFSPNLKDEYDYPQYSPGMRMSENVVFEIRHPNFPYKFVPGYCVKVLGHGYIRICTDWTDPKQLTETIIHVTSDYLLPPGFCKKHNIPFKNDQNNKELTFWQQVEASHDGSIVFVPPVVDKRPNPFRKGGKIETVDVIAPYKIYPGTIVQVAERLLKIHFDGRNRNDPKSFQWISCDSGAIYPVGYAAMMGFATNGKPDKPNLADHITFT